MTEQGHEDPLGLTLGVVERKLAKLYTQALADQPLTPSQFFLLHLLWFNDGKSLKDLGRRAQLDATSVTWIIDQLEHAHLVRRERSSTDRRIVHVWLTEAGREIMSVLVNVLDKWEDPLWQKLLLWHTPEEVVTFRRVLTTLGQHDFQPE
jgi:DNA-binding MarR family transcriptional regulator